LPPVVCARKLNAATEMKRIKTPFLNMYEENLGRFVIPAGQSEINKKSSLLPYYLNIVTKYIMS